MATVTLVRRWGSHPAGETVDVDDTQARFLLDAAFAVRPGDEASSRHGGGGVYPGSDGADLRAGGDPTRLRMTNAISARVREGLSGRVAGAPRRSGDVTHVAPENLGKEHKGDKGDVLLASGKTLREDLEEQQRELDEQDRKRDLGEDTPAEAQDGPQASGESPPEGSPGRVLTQPKK